MADDWEDINESEVLSPSDLEWKPSPYRNEPVPIIPVRINFAKDTVLWSHRTLLQERCPKLADRIDNATLAINLSGYSAGVGHALVHFLHTWEYQRIVPTNADTDRRASRAGLMARLEACILARDLEFPAFEKKATDDLLYGIQNIGASPSLDIVKAAYPRPLSEDPEFEAVLSELSDSPILFMGDWGSLEGWLEKPRPMTPDWGEVRREHVPFAEGLRDGYRDAMIRYWNSTPGAGTSSLGSPPTPTA
ncbi:hypothetical protein VTJ49DRAFT_715 [Mycothermus thermophilus]|uniref:Uncharacterized protein n=1 Tax=Humicola insolens TaxID=85995 RepID=A0ABR3VED1_HUMIN